MKSGRLFDEFEESPNQLGIISEPGKIALMKLQKGFFFRLAQPAAATHGFLLCCLAKTVED